MTAQKNYITLILHEGGLMSFDRKKHNPETQIDTILQTPASTPQLQHTELQAGPKLDTKGSREGKVEVGTSLLSDLDIHIPNNILSQHIIEQSIQYDPGATLAQIILDTSRAGNNGERAFYFGNKAQMPQTYLFTEMPEKTDCAAILLNPTKRTTNGDKINQVIKFLKEHLTEKGFNKLLEVYNQSELNYYHLPLSEIREQKNAVWSNAKTAFQITYKPEEDTLIFELRASNIRTINIDNIEKSSSYLFNADTVIGMTSTFNKNGIERNLYTSSQEPGLLNLILDHQLQNHINMLEDIHRKSGATMFAMKSPPLAEYRKLKAVMKRNQPLATIFLNNGNHIPKLMETAVDIQIDLLPTIYSLNLKIEQIKTQVNNLVDATDFQEPEREIFLNMQKNITLLEVELLKNYNFATILSNSLKNGWSTELLLQRLDAIGNELNKHLITIDKTVTDLPRFRGIL
jgi:hypothetical protein